MPKFKFLYSFSNQDVFLVEIERLDQPENSDLSSIYKWLVISHDHKKVLELDFKSMSSSLRVFQEGEVSFDDVRGYLKLLGKEYTLERNDINAVPTSLTEVIHQYLSENEFEEDYFSFRHLKPADVEKFKRWVIDQEVIRYSMTKFHKISNEDQIIQWFNNTIFDSKTFQWGIIDSHSKELIGYAGIASINDIDKNGEYFIFIGNKEYWGKGIATKVTREIVKEGFQKLNLHRIFLTASSKNPWALRAYEKAGFVHEGRMREAFYRNDEFSDKIIMGILRDEFIAK